jgi:hypothetical protein
MKTVAHIDAGTLERGMSYEEFKTSMTRNRERFEENERRAVLSPDDLAPFAALPRGLRVLVLAEDWCGDVVENLPILGRIAKETGKLELRVFLRDQNAELMDRYLNQGKFRSIPVFAFFDDEMREVGHFIERPRSVSELRGRRRADLHALHPEFGPLGGAIDALPEEARLKLRDAIAAILDETRDFARREVIRELQSIVARAR